MIVSVLSYVLLASSSLMMIKARRFTRLYPLSVVSAILFLLTIVEPFLDVFASVSLYVVVYSSLKNGFLTYEGFEPRPLDTKIVLVGVILIALGFLEGVDVNSVASRIVLANTFSMLAMSRAKTPVRVGDYEMLTLISLLFLSDGVIYVLRPWIGCVASIVNVHVLYTSSLLFLLTMIRRS